MFSHCVLWHDFSGSNKLFNIASLTLQGNYGLTVLTWAETQMNRTKLQLAALPYHVIACISVWSKHWHCNCCQEACIHIINLVACSTETKSESRSRVAETPLLYHHALLLCSDWPPQSPRTSPGSPLPGTHWGRRGSSRQLHKLCVYICCLCILSVNI